MAGHRASAGRPECQPSCFPALPPEVDPSSSLCMSAVRRVAAVCRKEVREFRSRYCVQDVLRHGIHFGYCASLLLHRCQLQRDLTAEASTRLQLGTILMLPCRVCSHGEHDSWYHMRHHKICWVSMTHQYSGLYT
jgi:hypothetical protein